MNNSNIYAFSNQELVSFMQKVGQHDAAKVIQKYDLNGERLMAFPSQNTDYSKSEQTTLMRCINLIQLNPLSSVKNLKTEFPDDEEDYSVYGSAVSSKSEEENLNEKLLGPKHDPLSNIEDDSESNMYFGLARKPEPTKDKQKATRVNSNQYFTFSKETTSKQQETVQLFEGRPNDVRSTVSSASYIRPNTLFVPRHEEIVVDRIKKFVKSENIVGNRPDHVYDDLLPNQVVYIDEENQKDKKNGKRVMCDFIMNMCCFSCVIGCHQK